MSGEARGGGQEAGGWGLALGAMIAVLAANLALVAAAGTDIPFLDQWDVEGHWLLPAWCDGTWRVGELLRAHNEHRIFWTHLLNLGLFAGDGQWDPLVELAACAVLRAAVAGELVWLASRAVEFRGRIAIAVGVAWAFSPGIGWHNVLWGFQSQVFFTLGFSLAALAWLGEPERPGWRTAAGMVAGLAALLAMGPAALVPVALLGLAALRMVETRRFAWRAIWPSAGLLAVAWALRTATSETVELHSASCADFFTALGRALAWPHTAQPWAAVVMNLPLVLAVGLRGARRRRAAAGETFAVVVGLWAAGVAAAAAWARGGGAEWAAGVPSRYADFFVLLPLANAWCAVMLARETAARGQGRAKLAVAGWILFLLVGWAGLSAEMWRGVIAPRARDREAPVRLMRAYQQTGDAAVFAGQPRLLVPHTNLESVRAVLDDPRMRGRLPPSLQPERPMGPLSRAVRWALRRQ